MYVVMKCINSGHRLPLSMHSNQLNVSLGAVGPIGTYVVMKCIDRGHRLTYDPYRRIETNQMCP